MASADTPAPSAEVGVVDGFDAAAEKAVFDAFLDWNFSRYLDDGENIEQTDFCSGSILEYARSIGTAVGGENEDEEEEDDDDGCGSWGPFEDDQLLEHAATFHYTALGIALLKAHERLESKLFTVENLASALRRALVSGCEAMAFLLLRQLQDQCLASLELPGGSENNLMMALGTGGSVSVLRHFLSMPPDLAPKVAEGIQAAFLAACQHGHLNFVTDVLLLEGDLAVDLTQALPYAAYSSDPSIAQTLLDVPPPRAVDVRKVGDAALLNASHGRDKTLRLLLSLTGDREIDARGNNSRAWLQACEGKHEECILAFCDLPPSRLPDMNVKYERHDLYAFYNVAGAGLIRAVKAMLAVPPPNQLDLARAGGFALHQAAWNGHPAVVRALLEAPHDRGLPMPGDHRSLRGAACQGHLEVVRVLLAERGARELSAKQSDYQALTEASGKYPGIVKELLLMTGRRAIPASVIDKYPKVKALLPDALWEGGVCRPSRRAMLFSRLRRRERRV